jgi:hypothetical protein
LSLDAGILGGPREVKKATKGRPASARLQRTSRTRCAQNVQQKRGTQKSGRGPESNERHQIIATAKANYGDLMYTVCYPVFPLNYSSIPGTFAWGVWNLYGDLSDAGVEYELNIPHREKWTIKQLKLSPPIIGTPVEWASDLTLRRVRGTHCGLFMLFQSMSEFGPWA